MQKKIRDYLSDLSVLFGPSSRENEVQKWLSGHFRKHNIDVCGDAVGNLWTPPRNDGSLRCGLVAHADEIGVQIVSIEPSGIARFRKIGGLRATSLIGQRLKFRNSEGDFVYGVVGADPMQDNGLENGLIVKTSDLWIDIGVESGKEFEERLSIGDFGIFDITDLTVLSGSRICGKAFDDRSGLAVGLCSFEETRSLRGIDPVFISTVQEEINLGGARALPLDVDIAIILDVDFCSDTPSALRENTELNLGKGVGLCISVDSSSVLLDLAREIAAERDIPLQITLGRNMTGGTDAAALRLKKATATIVLGIPLRYMHTAREIADMRDIVNAVRLSTALMERLSLLNNKTDLIPWK